MAVYKAFNKQVFEKDQYKIVPIRFEDRYDIMKWRNEQIYHLRQNQPLTIQQQDEYFEGVVATLFEQSQPNQILVSFLENNVCVGYGGLVHINWIDKHAEISFVMNTALEKQYFQAYWTNYLYLIEQLATEALSFHKIFTYAYDLRPHLYDALLQSGFKQEAVLKEHCFFDGQFIDVLIHSKFLSSNLMFKLADISHAELLYNWANDPEVRNNAFNQNTIEWNQHLSWFNNKLNSSDSEIYIFYSADQPIGQVRIDYNDDNKQWIIDYSIDQKYRGKGYGFKILKLLIDHFVDRSFTALVKTENVFSSKIFRKLGFELLAEKGHESTISIEKFVLNR